MNKSLCIYQNTNTPLFIDEQLTPSTEPNHQLFGSFMGNFPINHPARKLKRKIIERIAGSKIFLESRIPEFKKLARDAVSCYKNKVYSTHKFSLLVTSYVVSRITGFLDFHDVPIDTLIYNDSYGDIPTDYFEIASKIISHQSYSLAESEIEIFIRTLLLNNFKSIQNSPKINIVKNYFNQWGIEFSRDSIKRLELDHILELGTIIIAMYDTSSLSLTWLLVYLESRVEIKEKLIKEVQQNKKEQEQKQELFDSLMMAVLEAIRLGGANPTALWRKTCTSVTIAVGNEKYEIPEGTFVWLDRFKANRNSIVFSNANEFDLKNICDLIDSFNKPLLSLLARSRYQVNSFSMINTVRNPRKCPGRLFSVFLQSSLLEILLDEEYNVYEYDLSLKPFKAMPMPKKDGKIKIKN